MTEQVDAAIKRTDDSIEVLMKTKDDLEEKLASQTDFYNRKLRQ